MKKTKKILKIFLISIVVIIGLLVASTYLFRDKIFSMVKKEINSTLMAQVDFKEVDISFFRHFPRVSIGLNDLQIVGIGGFEGDTLLSAKRIDAAVNIMSFIRGKDMNIYSVYLNAPRVHALVDEEGDANWNIVREDTAVSASESRPFHLQLRKYSVKDGYVFYEDKQGGMSAEVEGLNHSGSGDFSSDRFTLNTQTTADAVTFFYGAIPYLYKVKTRADADIAIDNTTDTYSFDNVNILLNALSLSTSGNMKFLDEGYGMDVSFRAPDTDFKHILSLIPAVYKKDFNAIQASGTTAFEGKVKGTYSDNSIPGYHVSLSVKDGAFKYPDLPKGVDQINLNAVIDNPDGQTDNNVVDISEGSFRMGGQDKFDFRLLLKHPVTAMFVDAAAKGKLDLAQVSQLVKLDKGTEIAGLLDADLNVKGNVSDLEKQQYQNFYAGGILNLNGFKYQSPDYPDGVKINTLRTKFSPSKIDISDLAGEYLKTNFKGSGKINNLMNYLFANQPLSADITVNADRVDLNRWMGTDTTESAASADPFVVPGNLNVVLSTKVGEVDYDRLDIRNLSGSLKIADQTVTLNNLNGDALDGKIAIDGSYSTKLDKKKPAIALTYRIDDVDIQKTFYAFNTAQKLMPIGKFLGGKLTSALSAKGRLGEGMQVDMSSLSGNGNMLLIEGALSKFAPLDKIASTLNVAQLKNISMKDVKAFIEFTDGDVLVRPFTVKLKDIEMEIGGLQGLDESIDYTVNLKLPRKLLGAQGNQLIDGLAAKVSNTGIPVNLGETVNLMLKLGGTIQNPTIRTDLKQAGESLASQMTDQVKGFAEAKVESARQAAKDSLDGIKKQITNTAKEELTKKLLGTKDTAAAGSSDQLPIGKQVEKSAKGLLQGILGNKKKDTTTQK